MLPADTIAEITTAIAALHLTPDTTAQILAAVFAPLLRTADLDPVPVPAIREKRVGRRRRSSKRARGGPRRRYHRVAPSEARERAIAALKANPPDTSATEIAKLAKVSRSTVIYARNEIEKAARKAARETSSTAKPKDPRERAQRFLREQLARGAKPASAVEDAAEKAHVGVTALDQARADLGVVTTRANAGGVQAVEWSLPG